MDSFSNFIHMGGYAGYVWTSYGIALVIFVWSVVSPIIQKRQLIKRIKSIVQDEQG